MYKTSQIITAFVGVIGILGGIFGLAFEPSAQALVSTIMSVFVIHFVYQTGKKLKDAEWREVKDDTRRD